MSDTLATVTSDDGITVTSTSETPEQITEILKPEPAPAEETTEVPEKPTDPKLAKAASKLGKAGGEAAAAKRAEAKATEEAEAEGVAAETTKDAEAEKLGKPRHDPKARMLEATRQAAEAKRERDTIKARADQLERELSEARQARKAGEPAPPDAPKSLDGTKRPTPEDFDSYDAPGGYLDARDAWNRRQWETEAAEQARFTARDTGIRQAVTAFQGRMDEHAKADGSFKERTADLAASLQPSFTLGKDQRLGPLNVVADEIINSEHGPALMLHFVDHPEDLQRIEALRTPADVQVEVRFIAKGLAAAPTATAPKAEVSQARPPTRPVVGSPHTADQVPGENASYEDHKRYWNSKDRAARR